MSKSKKPVEATPIPEAIAKDTPVFTGQHAQALISVARSAPYQNMDHAESTQRLLVHFANWYNALPSQFRTAPAVAQPKD